MDFKKMLQRKREMTPDHGYNVVGVDSFDVGDELYLIGHYTTEDEAHAAVSRHKKESEDQVHIYTKQLLSKSS